MLADGGSQALTAALSSTSALASARFRARAAAPYTPARGTSRMAP